MSLTASISTSIITSSADLSTPSLSISTPSVSIPSSSLDSSSTSTTLVTSSPTTSSMSSSTPTVPSTSSSSTIPSTFSSAPPSSSSDSSSSTALPPSSTESPSSSAELPSSSSVQPSSSSAAELPSSSTEPPPSSSTPPPSSTSQPTPSSTPEPPSSTAQPFSSSTTPVVPTSSPSEPTTSSQPPPSSPLDVPSSTSTPVEVYTTFPSTVYITTTDSQGFLTSTAPPIVTLKSLSTNKDGSAVTVTQIIANPSLIPNNSPSKDPVFFHNKGAVAAVFLLVGLATASIFLWIFFAVRRRRRTQRMEHDSAVSATLAAAGFHRTPLDDDDDPGTTANSHHGSPDVLLRHRRSSSGLAMSSIPSAGRSSAPYLDTTPLQPLDDSDPGNYNPYSDYIVPPNPADGYASTPPPPSAFIAGPHRDRNSTGTNGDLGGHALHSRNGSYEPLLASYYRRSVGTPPPAANATLQRSSSQRYSDSGLQPPGYASVLGQSSPPPDLHDPHEASTVSSIYSSQSTGDDRLDPGLRQRFQDDSDSTRDLRDEEDYSRPVLGIRNLPDMSNQASVP